MGPVAPHPALPVEFGAVDEATHAALEAADGADRWDAGTRQRALAWVRKHEDVLAVLEGKVLTAERDAGTWALKGDRDLPDLLNRLTRQGRGAGFAAVGQATTLALMPVVAEALVEGPVTATHVREITRLAATSPTLAAELSTAEGQARLVDMAGRMDAPRFGKALKRLGASLDPASRQREHDEQRASRFLHLAHTPGGTLIKGLVDLVTGYKFQKAIDALNPRPVRGDERDHGQRQADALGVMVDRALADRSTTPGAVAPVQALVTFAELSWLALRAARGERDLPGGVGGTRDVCGTRGVHGPGRTDVDNTAGVGEASGRRIRPSRGSTPDLLGALRGAPPVVDEDGRPWPASELARALCDCELTRAVVGADGQVLDLGRGQRLFGKAQWLALRVSGQTTCAVDGCAMPLRYAELHHMAWWDRDGGPTDLANCAPECSFHHHEIHRLDIRVRRRADGTYEHRWPDGRLYGGAMPTTGSPTMGMLVTGPSGAGPSGAEPSVMGRVRDRAGP